MLVVTSELAMFARLTATLSLTILATWSAAAAAGERPMIRLRAATFDTRHGRPPVPAGLEAVPTAGHDYWLVQFDAPLNASHRQAIAALEGEVVGPIPERSLLVRLTTAQAEAVAGRPDVRFVDRYHPAYRLSPEIGQRPTQDPERQADDHLWLAVQVFLGESLSTTALRVEDAGAQVVALIPSNFGQRLAVRAHPDILHTLARIRAIQWIEPWPEAMSRNDSNAWIVQSNLEDAEPVWEAGLTGQGAIVGLIDEPMDLESCYFRDPADNTPSVFHRKVVAYRSTTGPGADNHGTHVAGTLAGDQKPITGVGNDRGIAPDARISFANQLDVTGFGNVTSNLADYLTFAHQDGARMHSNSWGDDFTTAYTTWCYDIDAFSRTHEFDLVGFAITNLSALKTPENAKNCLAVSATRDTPDQHQQYSGGAGPTADGRTKPEICAPGRATISADAGEACATRWSSGTSMACPVVMGAGVLVRDYFLNGYQGSGSADPSLGFEPTGALVKATLIAGTVDMEPAGYPSVWEGFGRLLLDDALYFEGDQRRLWVEDVQHAQGLATGEAAEFFLETTGAPLPLRIVMVFMDEPATLGAAYAPVNDLDLEVIDGAQSYWGNALAGGASVPDSLPDPLNTVELVLLPAPAATRFTVTVHANQVAGGRQGFALVATGPLSPPATTGLAAAGARPKAPVRMEVAPNPFNPTTSITLRIDEHGDYRLRVHDVAGRTVATVVDQTLAPGLHRFRWAAPDAASGIYWLELHHNGRVAARTRAVMIR